GEQHRNVFTLAFGHHLVANAFGEVRGCVGASCEDRGRALEAKKSMTTIRAESRVRSVVVLAASANHTCGGRARRRNLGRPWRVLGDTPLAPRIPVEVPPAAGEHVVPELRRLIRP